ncbi:MAG: RidA family protein [Woeseia sp.]
MKGPESIHSRGAAAPVGPYPHARRVGKLLFLSGIGPRPADGGPVAGSTFGANGAVVDYDMEKQCHAVFRNVSAVLESAGCTLEDLVDITTYLTDMRRDFDTFNRVYGEYFSPDGPCRTTVEVTRLPTPIAIEVKCIAFTGAAPRQKD